MEPPQPPRCDCTDAAFCRRTYSNGTEHVVSQCRGCGRQLRCLSKSERVKLGLMRGRLPAFDEEVATRWHHRQKLFWEQHRRSFEREREEKDAEWQRRYDAHMASPEWRELRRKVMARCRGVCEGCGARAAVQVHHLTYRRLGREMLFDLVGVCLPCHEEIHRDAAGGQAGAYPET